MIWKPIAEIPKDGKYYLIRSESDVLVPRTVYYHDGSWYSEMFRHTKGLLADFTHFAEIPPIKEN